MSTLELLVDGKIYAGWTELAVEAGLEQLSGSFTLQLTERWPDSGEPRPINAGQPCVVKVDDLPVVTGFIDSVSVSFNATSRTLSVSGRDVTADLIDCSAIHGAGQWKKASLARIARDLCKPYDIKVDVDASATALADQPFDSWNIEEGESCFDCLERAARLRTVMLTTLGDGKLMITRPGAEQTGLALVEGDNIVSASGNFSWNDRFSEYRVKGQSRRSHAGVGISKDAEIGGDERHRLKIVLAEDQADGPTAQQRADWERTIRAARSNRATITVCGWRQAPDQPLWRPNLRVRLTSSLLRADEEKLITKVNYTLSAEGERCQLELADPRSFDQLAGKSAGKSKTKSKG
ncbi:phage baseplate assembly protein [Jeongeupia naejangsanensis]|uniref:Phage tail protein n=1 Tax=Jeongeupia naejangsanensis TaxID=613195 RepID=A0ABS2BHA2_9NEIS|nr:hypothetical protein [Jeongeupia naejangsanensis]MBM3114997.1 hypothetical protein [Jeongeupia naejangsanensis]